ncbi:hypothetical protein ACFXKJ_19450 [Kitasatospora indigofera]|uniref:hypothetical protein n=1 Tax=Kitasatospora indigofera TaxID=67307 RepID=UPI0036C2875E
MVDIDAPGTWPTAVADLIAELAPGVRDHLDSASDLHNEAPDLAEFDGQVRELLAGCLVRTYHATRLLDHEIEDVRIRGLRILTDSSLTERADRALKAGVVTEDEHAALLESTALNYENPRNARQRIGELSVVTSRQPLAQGWPVRLLRNWGGEVRQFGPVWEGVDYEHLRRLGRPSLVVAGIDVATPAAVGTGRKLVFDFIGSHLDLGGNGITVHYTADIPGEQMSLATITPGQGLAMAFRRCRMLVGCLKP